MAVKYVKDFFFGPMTSVQRYAKGGHVTKVPAKAKDSAKGMPARAKPNAPAKGAKRMESPPKVGKGQGYKDGGKVPGKKMDRQPTKTPPGREKDLAPAKPFRGPKQGYAEGGDVQDPRFASIEPGAGSPLDAGAPMPFNANAGARTQYGEYDPYADRPVRDITLEPYRPPVFDERGLDRRANPLDLREPMPLPPVAPTRPYDAGTVEPLLEPVSFQRDRMSGDLLHKWDDGTYHYQPQLFSGQVEEGYNPDALSGDYYRNLSREALAAKAEPAMARAVRNVGTGRDVGLSDLMAAARAQGMMRRPGSPYAMYAKGGHVKGQAKVGKVMGEYKRGELHSGSKKGPLVKNPKQAVAIALSEARKSGAKIPRKEEGGLMASKPEVRKPKSVTVTKVTKTVSDAKDAALNEKKMLEFLRSLPKDEIADMMEKRAMQAPSMDPDMPKYRKGGMARKSVPVHKGKAMYGGGKC